MNHKIILAILTISLVFVSCQKESFYEGDHFFIKNKGAEMPVYIKGNTESNTIILFVHGGPGGSASFPSFLPVSKELEKDYGFAYWDQRGSGLSQGNPDESTFTLDQFVEDLGLVVDAINLRHNNPNIVLFGPSWGGALSSAYLSRADNQDKISGFICFNSGHNLLEGIPKSVVWVKEYAQEQIDAGIDIPYWTEARDWCATVPDMTIVDNYFKYDSYLTNTNAYRKDPNQEVQGPEVGALGAMNSYLSLSIFFNGGYLRPNFNILKLNLSPELHKIKIPTLVLWGRHDGVNTIEMGYDMYDNIGGPDFTQKEIIIMENSAHEGYIEEQELFIKSFRTFVDGI